MSRQSVFLVSWCLGGVLLSFAQDAPPAPTLKFVAAIGRYDKDRALSAPMSVDVDTAGGEILVADTGNNAIAVFDAEGKLKLEVGKGAELQAPIGAAFEKNGEIVVAEMGSSVLKVINVKGALADKIDLAPFAKGDPEKVDPGRLHIDGDGKLYVVDRANQQIIVLDAKRRLKMKVGGHGKEEGQLLMAQDVAVDRDGGLCVVSAKGTAVHRFGPDGKFLSRFGEHGFGNAEFSFPSGVAMDKKGRIWVADSFRQEVKAFDSKGKLLLAWGVLGEGEGEFQFPFGLAFDAKGRLHVVEKGGNRIQIFEVNEPAPSKVEGGK